MPKAPMWMVRAGEEGYLFDTFRTEGIVAIGWNELGNLDSSLPKDEVRNHYVKQFPTDKPGRVGNAVAVIHKFLTVLKPGHKVMTNSPDSREYLVGAITGEPEYDPTKDYHRIRRVQWEGTVDRDDLKAASRNSLGSTLTLFQVNDETADDLEGLLTGTPVKGEQEGEEKEELEQLKEDAVGRAHELITEKLLKLTRTSITGWVQGARRGRTGRTRGRTTSGRRPSR